MIRRLVFVGGALLVTLMTYAPAKAQTEATPPSMPAPKLIVAISVDQFSADLFNEYRAFYRHGLKRLARGVVFPSGFQGHAATETCPGHSTLLTGSRPARTGIIANNWQNPNAPRAGKGGKADYGVYCAEDVRAPGSNSNDYVVSPVHLRVPTLGDRLKAADPRAQVVSVSGKDRAAVMMGGPAADVTLWWDGKGFVSYKGREAALPAGVMAVNALSQKLIAKPSALKQPRRCKRYARAVAISDKASLGQLQQRKAGDAKAIRASGEFDALTLDAALTVMQERNLGRGPSTDVLAIGLSATDYVGHAFGTSGAEMCTNIAALDKTLGRMFGALDKTRVPYAVVLSADHGGHDMPERNRQNGMEGAERADMALMPQVLGPALAKRFNAPETVVIGDGPFGDMYFSKRIPAAVQQEAQDAALSVYRRHRQVAAVFTKAELIAAPAPSGPVEDWSLRDAVKASFDPERSGDFVVLLKRNVTPIPTTGLGYVATHGSPWGYDRRVPILFWWKGIAPFEQPGGIETADILPTLAPLIGLTVPSSEIDGRCIDLIAGAQTSCR
jgi:predicted AlkP superfamily pyrophosphatase or phosphodiesterase